MWDRDKVPAGRLTGFVKPSPEITGEGAVIKPKRREGLRLRCINVPKTMRGRFAPPGISEYSHPINAVNSPGWLWASAVS